jgi:pilus assembly protein CpaB
VAALIVAIIGTVLLITYINGSDARALAGVETRDVYVVQKTIAAGTPAANLGDSVTKRPLPKASVPDGALDSLTALQGKVATVALEPGETLLQSRFADPSALVTPGRVKVPDGMQELTLKLPIERVAGGAVAAGDTVGVVISADGGQGSTAGGQTQLTFHKVLVTAIQYSSGATAENGQSSPSTSGGGALNSNNAGNQGAGGYLVTIARTSADVEKIVYAQLYGQVYLTKEPSGAQENNGAPIDRTKVFR